MTPAQAALQQTRELLVRAKSTADPDDSRAWLLMAVETLAEVVSDLERRSEAA